MDEFKYHVLIQQPYAYTQSGYQGGFTGTVMQTADRRCLTCTPIRRKATLSACAIFRWCTATDRNARVYGDPEKNIHHARRLNLTKPALSLRSAFAGCDADASYPAYRTLQFIEFAMIVGRISVHAASGNQPEAAADFYLFTTIKCACIMSLAGRPCASKSAIAFKIWR